MRPHTTAFTHAAANPVWFINIPSQRPSVNELMRPNLGCHYQWLAFFQLEVTKRIWDKTCHEIGFATLSFVSNCTPLTTFSSQEPSFSIPIHWSLLLSIRESMCGSWLAPHQRSCWDWCRPTFMMSLILQHYSSTTQSKKTNMSVYSSDNLWSNYLLYRDNAVLLFCGVGFQYYSLQCITSKPPVIQ